LLGPGVVAPEVQRLLLHEDRDLTCSLSKRSDTSAEDPTHTDNPTSRAAGAGFRFTGD
jgi:hypothetical protein